MGMTQDHVPWRNYLCLRRFQCRDEASDGRLRLIRLTGKDFEGNGRGQIEVLSRNVPG
jgi:hypothetical protein